MNFRQLLFILSAASTAVILSLLLNSCAQIGAPTGGIKDTVAPQLVKASPALNSVEVKDNKISFTFDEYVEVRDEQNNVLVSPFPKTAPRIDNKLKTITVRLQDTLLPNTTYTIQFGNAIVDINEGNPLKDFSYTFSTGRIIDSLELTGNVRLAETGLADSTLAVMLYRNGDDSMVQKKKPDYLAKLTGKGNYRFTHLPAGNYKLYALKDGDGSKTYNSPTEAFAFLDQDIIIRMNTEAPELSAFSIEKENRSLPASSANKDKKLKYLSSASGERQDLLSPFKISFNNRLRVFDSSRILLTDTSFHQISGLSWSIDSTRKILSISNKWKEDERYFLILPKDAVTDTNGTMLVKSDTIRFKTMAESEYGSMVLRFKGLDVSKNPVIQFVKSNEIVESSRISSKEFSRKLFSPGEYNLRILYDRNNNGKWDPGNYSKKIQPEKVHAVPQRFTVRAAWDNEMEIEL